MKEELIRIGDRTFLIEKEPLSHWKLHEPCLVVWGSMKARVVKFDHNWYSGYEQNKDNKTYGWAKVEEINGTKWYHSSVNELYKVLATDSTKLQRLFNLPAISITV